MNQWTWNEHGNNHTSSQSSQKPSITFFCEDSEHAKDSARFSRSIKGFDLGLFQEVPEQKGDVRMYHIWSTIRTILGQHEESNAKCRSWLQFLSTNVSEMCVSHIPGFQVVKDLLPWNEKLAAGRCILAAAKRFQVGSIQSIYSLYILERFLSDALDLRIWISFKMNRFRKFSGESWKIGVDLISACKCRTTASPSITDGFVSSFMFAFGTMLAPSSSNQILLFRRFRRLCAYAPQGFRRISFYHHDGKPLENDRKTTGKRLENPRHRNLFWRASSISSVLLHLRHFFNASRIEFRKM